MESHFDKTYFSLNVRDVNDCVEPYKLDGSFKNKGNNQVFRQHVQCKFFYFSYMFMIHRNTYTYKYT